MAHTPQSPNKNRVRRDWIKAANSWEDIITISHGALEMLMALEWHGKITVCDIDPGVIEATRYMKETEYPELKIIPVNCSIQTLVKQYCEYQNVKNLAVVDVDLACCMQSAQLILSGVLEPLIEHKAQDCKVLLTFRNGRDGFKTTEDRITWLKQQLPHGVKYVSHQQYNSTGITKHAEREKGSAMCIVD